MLAALYDVHGNLPALEAVLDEVLRAGVTRIIVGGDVLPGPMPVECLASLRNLDIPVQFIRGNGDRVVLAARAGDDITDEVPEAFRDVIHWNAAKLDDETAGWMQSWPAMTSVHHARHGEIMFCHASARNDTDIFTRLTPDQQVGPLFAGTLASTVVCGHTHMQFDRRIGRLRVVNAGSVGMSFQGPGAYWLLIDDDDMRLRRTEYDLAAAATRVRATGFPRAGEFAANNIERPPQEAVMLETFGKVPLRP